MYTGSVGMPVKDLSGPYSNSTGRGVVLLRPQVGMCPDLYVTILRQAPYPRDRTGL